MKEFNLITLRRYFDVSTSLSISEHTQQINAKCNVSRRILFTQTRTAAFQTDCVSAECSPCVWGDAIRQISISHRCDEKMIPVTCKMFNMLEIIDVKTS